jgi:hypothetical protein
MGMPLPKNIDQTDVQQMREITSFFVRESRVKMITFRVG